jgi:hypothetical protein
MVEAIFWQAQTGRPWRDIPSVYGPWQSVYTRFTRWARSGVLHRIAALLDHPCPSPPLRRTRGEESESGSETEGSPEEASSGGAGSAKKP